VSSISRRAFLTGAAALAAAPLLPLNAAEKTKAWGALEFRLAAGTTTAQLAPADYPATAVWAYNGSAPGPVLRVRQGDRLRVTVENRLAEATTVHWHGVRLPNAMDGVPFITQPPIEPGGEFIYDFVVPDAGTYWYHPHQRTFEQSGRGLHGALIVEEREPMRVDRDVVWVLGDWRVTKEAAIAGAFGSFMDVSHAGRIGNLVTINGVDLDQFVVRAGERIRLRLVNAANARVFALEFRGHRPRIVALDGQPVAPHEPQDGRIVLGPAMRADLVLDMDAEAGSAHEVRDTFYRQRSYRLVELSYSRQPPLASERSDWPLELPANPLSEPDVKRAERHEIVFSGGMMGDMRGIPRGMAWAVNGAPGSCGDGQPFDPLLWLKLGRSYILRLVNETAWPHPIHLHGHAFRVVRRNDRPAPHREWLDTVLIMPRESAEIAFVADNPGDWMFHCHVLEHQAFGMMACLRVA
jgi:FtsP/CotA-like multicopper oxidase with cupredoxin domain